MFSVCISPTLIRVLFQHVIFTGGMFKARMQKMWEDTGWWSDGKFHIQHIKNHVMLILLVMTSMQLMYAIKKSVMWTCSVTDTGSADEWRLHVTCAHPPCPRAKCACMLCACTCAHCAFHNASMYNACAYAALTWYCPFGSTSSVFCVCISSPVCNV